MTLNSFSLRKHLVLAILLGLAAPTFAVDDKSAFPRRFVNKDIVKEIKASNISWVPYEPELNPFRNKSDDEIQHMFGLNQADQQSPIQSKIFRNRKGQHYHKTDSSVDEEQIKLLQALPDSFDARVQWPNCIHDVRDQGDCGSCWAFSTAGFLEDRFCIASNGAVNVRLSPQDMITCDHQNGGCNGGFLTPAMNFAISRGVVSDECMPYKGQTGYCTYQCHDWTQQYKKYHCKPGSLKMLTDEVSIKQELVTNGPMQVGFTVYTDFMSYQSGIYEYVTGWNEGGHAVKLIGWNYFNNRLYWVLQNQWGANWGENGYFNVYAGEVGLDSTVFACDPDLSQQSI